MQSGVSAARCVFAVSLLGLALQACTEGPAQPTAQVVPEVSFVTLQAAPRPAIRELPGRIAPTRIAEVRARVSGIVIERTFEQGTNVEAGDVLYRIDPVPFEVELQSTEAALAKANAVLEQKMQQSTRVDTLFAGQAASRAQQEMAIAALREAEAEVAARNADVARAKLALDRTVIRAPISGRIGRALVTEGALVGQGEITHLATIQQLNRVYADFTQSVGELSKLQKAFESGDLERVSARAAKTRLILDGGEVYPYAGKLLFSDSTVDPSTGQVTLRGEFPNPKHELLPGMYVRVQIEEGIDPDAIAVPQQAIRRNDAGVSEVFVLRQDNRVVLQPVRLGRAIDDEWQVLDGLKPDDRIVVDGFQKFAPGDTVKPSPWRGMRTADAHDTSGTRAVPSPKAIER
jgi:membrane fusion protein (multidrug efflux system)